MNIRNLSIGQIVFEERVACVDDFIRLRVNSGLSARTREGAEKGLVNSLYGVTAFFNDQAVGMARVVGDGGLNFEIVDVAVDKICHGKGIGKALMNFIMAYLERDAPKGAYITLIGDEPVFYQKFGFSLTRPESEGMYKMAT